MTFKADSIKINLARTIIINLINKILIKNRR